MRQPPGAACSVADRLANRDPGPTAFRVGVWPERQHKRRNSWNRVRPTAPRPLEAPGAPGGSPRAGPDLERSALKRRVHRWRRCSTEYSDRSSKGRARRARDCPSHSERTARELPLRRLEREQAVSTDRPSGSFDCPSSPDAPRGRCLGSSLTVRYPSERNGARIARRATSSRSGRRCD
jgi:hypothetical protein